VYSVDFTTGWRSSRQREKSTRLVVFDLPRYRKISSEFKGPMLFRKGREMRMGQIFEFPLFLLYSTKSFVLIYTKSRDPS
jgi:hypothetical protein